MQLLKQDQHIGEPTFKAGVTSGPLRRPLRRSPGLDNIFQFSKCRAVGRLGEDRLFPNRVLCVDTYMHYA